MLTRFWEGFGDKLADRWNASLIAPAFAFWAVGFLSTGWRFGWDTIRQWFTTLTEIEQIIVLIGGLVLVAVSAEVVRALIRPTLRIIEGYWPAGLSLIRRLLLTKQQRKASRAEARYQKLATKGAAVFTNEERLLFETVDLRQAEWYQLWRRSFLALPEQDREELLRLEQLLRQYPADLTYLMPTRVGNILRAAELRPLLRYGLDPVICWPRLWMLLPDGPRKDLASARQKLDSSVQLQIWGFLILIWAALNWWAVVVGTILLFWGYRSTLATAVTYGDLLEAAFDTYRTMLYTSLRLPLPETTDERTNGLFVTQYLFRGPPDSPLPLAAHSDG